jgi:hypothetical protein
MSLLRWGAPNRAAGPRIVQIDIDPTHIGQGSRSSARPPGTEGAAKPLLHRSVSQGSTQPNYNGTAHNPRAMASGTSNRQIACHQDVCRLAHWREISGFCRGFNQVMRNYTPYRANDSALSPGSSTVLWERVVPTNSPRPVTTMTVSGASD